MPTSAGWYVLYKDLDKDLDYNEKFDYVIVCSGLEGSHKFEDDAASNAYFESN